MMPMTKKKRKSRAFIAIAPAEEKLLSLTVALNGGQRSQ
jgi:hypothetical protein